MVSYFFCSGNNYSHSRNCVYSLYGISLIVYIQEKDLIINLYIFFHEFELPYLQNYYFLDFDPINYQDQSEDMQHQVNQNQKKELASRVKFILQVGASSNKWKKLANRTKDRYYRFRELFTTQQDYKRDLISIKQKIMQPLLDAKIIGEFQIPRMFSGVDSMISLSGQLRQELAVKFDTWDRRKTMLGQTMTKFSKFLLVYNEFFKNFNETQKRLKQILAQSEKARQIQKSLSTQTRIITFEDLMSKPFQRPLKYHLILRDYASKIQKWHIDYKYLQDAIECYHKVNEQNNLSLENKEKDQMLMMLDSKFGGNIIETQARYFVKEYQAIFLDTIYNMYILSDMVILAQKNTVNHMRIYFNKYSYVQNASDGKCFVNRIFFYGRSICVHLSFLDANVKTEVYEILNKLLENTNKNETQREEIISMRTTRQSVLQRRRSFTNLQPQFKRPMIAKVLGCEKRFLSPDKDKIANFFIIQFFATPPNLSQSYPSQITYVTLQTLLKIQNLGRSFYRDEQFAYIYPIQSRTKDLTDYEYKKNENKRIQLQSLHIQLFLNSLFRNDKILKRIDFVSYLLKMSEPLWLHLNEKYVCSCKFCGVQAINYENPSQYFAELEEREYNKTKIQHEKGQLKRKYFCDIRTLSMQQAFSQIPYDKIKQTALQVRERIAYIKSHLGWINHSFTHPKPQSKKINVTIYTCNSFGNQSYLLDIYTSFRVKTVVELLSKRLNFHLEDYSLVATINNKSYVLLDDEILGDLIDTPKEEGSFFGFFKPETYPIVLYLKKIWVLQNQIEKKQPESKLSLQVQDFICRLKTQQIKTAQEQAVAIYAYYFAYKHFIELETITLNKLKMKNEQYSKFVAPSLKSSVFYDRINQIIERLKKDQTLTTPRSVCERIIELASGKIGWSSFAFSALLMNNGREEGLEVRIGCDIKGLKIQEKGRVQPLLDFSFSDPSWSCSVNGFEFTIKQENEYSFFGRDLWKVRYQLQFYRLYREVFLAK